MSKKIKVLAYCDSPTCATGFATVSRNILTGLYKTGKYSIDILGINYWGDPHEFPFRIWPIGFNGENDPYGRKKAFGMIQQMDFDILFFLQDTFILDFLPNLHNYIRTNGKTFSSIVYFPIDGKPKSSWINNIVCCDNVVAYTEYGKSQVNNVMSDINKEIQVIPHGANVDEFRPLDKRTIATFREKYFGEKNKDKFIITNLNRNQRRKDIPRTIQAFKEFKKQVPESILYLHMATKDHQGWNLKEVCDAYGMSIKTDVLLPDNFSPNQGFPIEIVNLIYNASDVVVSTTLGEGFGLSWVEAMSTKTPVLMPDNTAMSEFITEDRGYLIKSGSDNNLKTILTFDNEVLRPMVDVDDMVLKLLDIYNNPEEAKKRADNAYNYVQTKLSWQGSIVPKWVELFDQAAEQAGSNINKVSDNKAIKTETF
jgi:glycosyltransferase involved in cell wall biosynthesis